MPGREVRVQRKDCATHRPSVGANLAFHQSGPHHPLPVECIERGIGPGQHFPQ